jgi:hypothetical protein
LCLYGIAFPLQITCDIAEVVCTLARGVVIHNNDNVNLGVPASSWNIQFDSPAFAYGVAGF